MIDTLKDIRSIGSWNEMREALGKLLGTEGPVSSSVLARALEDDHFASQLFISRFDKDLLDLYLNDKKNKEYELIGDAPKRSNMELTGKAAKALLQWGKSGLQITSKELYEKRISICEKCEFIKDPPDQLAYKVKLKSESDQRVCGACGCGVSRKAWLPTETCPVADPANKGLNLWGEPVK